MSSKLKCFEVSTIPATYIGILDPVGSLNISRNGSQVELTWTPPFSLNVTAIDPDIAGYCVAVMSNLNSSLQCNIQRTSHNFTLPSSAGPCDDIQFAVFAENGVDLGAPGVVNLSITGKGMLCEIV